MSLIENWTEVKTITLKLDSSSSDRIITVYENIKAQSATRFFPESSNTTCNAFIKNLQAKVTINSLPETPLPVFELTDTQQARTIKSLDIEWGTLQRYQLDLYISSDNYTWLEVGSISLLNPMGYPYRKYNLLDVFGTDLAIELGDNGRIGVAIRDVGAGLLKSGDRIDITGSVTEEATIVKTNVELPDNVTLGDMAFQPSNSVGITGGSIEGVRVRSLTEPLSLGSGRTGVNSLLTLKALLGLTQNELKTLLALTSKDINLQRLTVNESAKLTGTTLIPYDNTIPQATEGTQFLTISITPIAVGNKIRIETNLHVDSNAASQLTMALFQDNGVNAVGVASRRISASAGLLTMNPNFEVTITSLNQTTFKLRMGGSAVSTITLNGEANVAYYGGVLISSIAVIEYKPGS